jgi:hypothetical protein
MGPAEELESKYVLKHIRKLCDVAEEFLEHLAPHNATMHDDLHNILELRKPDADFTKEYRDFDTELNVHLCRYQSDQHNYIHVRAVHRALFGQDLQPTASQSGLDLILYLANLLIFAKQMIPSDHRDSKDVWDALRQLDNSFPSPFMHSIVANSRLTAAGESGLRDLTFDLALDLRTQLAIQVLQRPFGDTNLDPDEKLAEVFYRTDTSQASDGSLIRGWNVTGLGRDDSPLPEDLRNKVDERVRKIHEFLPMDAGSLERGDVLDLEGLKNEYPWEATILRLVHWVRLRHAELREGMREAGGSAAIVRKVKEFMGEPQPAVDSAEIVHVTRASPQRKRTSFGRNRRRSSRKFDPNAPVDLRTIDALKARERETETVVEDGATPQDLEGQSVQEAVEEEALGDDAEGPGGVPPVMSQQDDEQPAIDSGQPLSIEQTIEEVEELVEEPEVTGPPASSADILKALKVVSKPQKENRPMARSYFQRQPNAQRVDFGDGFEDSQPTPGPSNTQKGKQPAQSSPKKRPAPVDEDNESGDDAFEAEERGGRVHERRERAPVTKKVRIDPSSSGAPPSHQPPRRDVDREYVPTQQEQEQEESRSEGEPPEMTEEPPASSYLAYQAQKQLAYENRVIRPSQRTRRAPRPWTEEEETALLSYMEDLPAQYSAILKHDDKDQKLLQHRTQVDLKDKARTMAINMIKYVMLLCGRKYPLTCN